MSIVVCLLTTLTVMAPIAMTFADPWGDVFEERNAEPVYVSFKPGSSSTTSTFSFKNFTRTE
jgi:hypothetical protein